jgi:serine/threonine protein phosphatase PrpC
VTCPACGAPVLADDVYCEACGAQLGASTPAPTTDRPCVSCGAPAAEIDRDGYCGRCGHKQPPPHDHEETVVGPAAGVTDRGVKHHRNEDAMALIAAGSAIGVVVCDGVSQSQNPQDASQAAADAAIAVLRTAMSSASGVRADAMVEAARAANAAVLEVPWERGAELGPPSCTFVGATVAGNRITVAWLGDSRAYWITAASGRALTQDDSWATAQVAAGRLTPSEALGDNQSHAITAWLGADAPTLDPHVSELVVDEPGIVVVCSDGLWNYAPTDAELRALIGPINGEEPLALARRLTRHAIDAGGHDNITVIVVTVGGVPDGDASDHEGIVAE